jgi:hypothetical protein
VAKISDITVKLELDTTEATQKLNVLEEQLNRIAEKQKHISTFHLKIDNPLENINPIKIPTKFSGDNFVNRIINNLFRRD